jgi:prephenate dehydrogenase
VFSVITILAPGLLGASVAKAARARGLAERIHVWSRRPETRVALKSAPWCDAVFDSPAAACATSELVVIAAPVERIVPLVEQIGPSLPPDAVVTDVGSVKSEICRLGSAALRGHGTFVGSHPMAGSEKSGWEHSREDLFNQRPCFVTPLSDTDPAATEKVVAFWSALGCQVASAGPEEHDEIVAHISHLPHLLASTLCSMLASRPARWRHFAGPGLKDATRIASGDPGLWREILASNREEVLRALRRLQDDLEVVHATLANRDDFALAALLERGQAFRDTLRPEPGRRVES